MLSAGRVALIAAALFSISFGLVLGGCRDQAAPGGLSGFIKIIGSNTVTPISAVWAEIFVKDNPGVNIAVSGPGSGAGIASLIDGTIDIAQSSRDISSLEIKQATARGVEPFEIVVANDGLAVVLNPANPVNELTIEQLSGIYTNRISNWREVGGNDAPIVALSRDTDSGTHVFFKEHVVQMRGLATENKKLEYGSRVLFLPSTEEGVSEVARNPNAVFYSGLGYVSDRVKVAGIKKTAGDAAVKPSVQTVLGGAYAIARPLLFYTNGAPRGIVKAFIDYCLSDAGQQEVTKEGFVPVR